MSCASLQRFDTWPVFQPWAQTRCFLGDGGPEGLFAHDRHRVVHADQHLRREIRCTSVEAKLNLNAIAVRSLLSAQVFDYYIF
jgi:hypothetical protein